MIKSWSCLEHLHQTYCGQQNELEGQFQMFHTNMNYSKKSKIYGSKKKILAVG